MSFKLIRHDEVLPPRNIVTILFGEPGVGKTSLTFTADKPVLLAYDAKGLDRAVNRKDAIQFKSWAESMELIESNTIEENGYITAIIDTGGAMLDEFLAPHIVGINEKFGNGMGGLGLSGYGVMKDSFGKFCSAMEKKGVDLIFICHTSIEKEGDNMIRMPKMTGGSYDILVQKADLMGFIEMKNNKITLDFNPTSRHVGKNCARFPILEVPSFESKEYHSFMANIIRDTKAHMLKLSQAQQEAIKLVDGYKTQINQATDLENLELIFQDVQDQTPSIKAQISQLLNEKSAAIWMTSSNLVNLKTIEDFEKITPSLKTLRREIQLEISDSLRKALDTAGLIFDKINSKYKPKPATAPQAAATPPTPSTPVVPLVAKEKAEKPKAAVKKAENKTEAQEPPKPEEPKTDNDIPPLPEEWFIERIGKKVIQISKDGVRKEITIESQNRADHLYGVSQNMKGCSFEDIAIPAEAPTAVGVS